MIVSLLWFGLGELLDRHSVAARVILLVGLFLVGYAEAKILKSLVLASVTWLLALAAACIWIAYPATFIRIAVGSGAFLLGVIAMMILFRKRPKDGLR